MTHELKETLHILNSREKKPIVKAIKEQWGVDFKPDVLLQSNKRRIYIMTKDLDQVDWSVYKVDNVGLYIGKMEAEIRLSIEGSQIIGPDATKNVIEVTDEEAKLWFSGEDILRDADSLKGYSGYVILKNKDDFLGSGKVIKEKILNFVPKGRRISSHM